MRLQRDCIYCRHDQSVWQAAAEHGYPPPAYCVGIHQSSRPRDGETLVAWVKADGHSIPLPIFKKESQKEEIG